MLEWLQGKKTYIVAVLFAVFNLGVGLGWWTPDSQLIVAIDGLLVAFGFGFLKAGQNRTEKKVEEKL